MKVDPHRVVGRCCRRPAQIEARMDVKGFLLWVVVDALNQVCAGVGVVSEVGVWWTRQG